MPAVTLGHGVPRRQPPPCQFPLQQLQLPGPGGLAIFPPFMSCAQQRLSPNGTCHLWRDVGLQPSRVARQVLPTLHDQLMLALAARWAIGDRSQGRHWLLRGDDQGFPIARRRRGDRSSPRTRVIGAAAECRRHGFPRSVVGEGCRGSTSTYWLKVHCFLEMARTRRNIDVMAFSPQYALAEQLILLMFF